MQLNDVGRVAKMLGISTWTVRAYARSGKLRPVRIGRLVRFEDSEIQRFVSEECTGISRLNEREAQR